MAPNYVRLISSDGFTYIISKEAAMVSGMIRGMLNSEQFEESQTGHLRLDFNGALLSKVVDYFYYNLAHAQNENAHFEVPPEMALELLVAADFLDT